MASNEQYLICSYFLVALLALAMGIGTYWLFRRSFADTMRALKNQSFSRILRNLFPIGIVFPALIGFLSVSFKSCGMETYSKIIAQRSYLVHKNEEQVSSTLNYLVVALLVWGLIVLLVLIASKKPTGEDNG